MKQIALTSFGLGHLSLTDVPELREPGPGEVRLRMRAASLNYRDLLMVLGHYNPKQPLPLVPASDGVGIVEAVGPDVTRVQVGDRVSPTFGQGWTHGTATADFRHITLGGPLDGTLREQMLVRADSVVRIPDALTDAEAAAVPCAGVTAWNALAEQGQLKAGETVLIQGTGGVALFALQIAKASGARVIITSSSDEKLDRCRTLGADETINYRSDPDWGSTARRLSEGGVDHVIELGGGDTLKQSIRAVRPGGIISMIGVLGGPTAELLLPLIVMQNIRLQGVTVGSRSMHERLLAAMSATTIRPVIDRTFPLPETRAAFEHLQAGRHFGKIALSVLG